jgi:3-oxo-4-pregnene-20-carboxyl-CoA dehydrogenase alpha subunit
VRTELSEAALDFGQVVRKALRSAGGDLLVQLAEEEPARRDRVASALGELGAWELDPRAGPDELEASAAACRGAGWWGVPYPVAERLARPGNLDVDALVVVSGARPAAAVACLDLRLAAVDLAGQRALASARPPESAPRKSAFVTELDLVPVDGDGTTDAPLGLVLGCWTLLGMLDRAIALTRDHVLSREQFGKSLASFQAVQFQLTDAEVERSGAEELAKYALWSLQTGRDEVLEDALALRLAVLEAADVVFRVAHQLHGAIGFCDETALSWLSRYSQPLRRLPLGLSATRDRLTQCLGHRGLGELFSEVEHS